APAEPGITGKGQREIELARLEAVGQRGSAILDETERDPWGRATPAGEEAGQAFERLGSGPEAEHSRATAPDSPGSLAERFRAEEEVPARGEEIPSLASDPDSAADTIEEPDAEVSLELADLTPEGGLTHP